nr:hypothetical protein [Tanacetum cinerariifolium]
MTLESNSVNQTHVEVDNSDMEEEEDEVEVEVEVEETVEEEEVEQPKGSTHNFIDTKVAKKVECLVKNTCPLQVSVAGGKRLVSTNICPDFVWKLKGETFLASMMTLSLGGCDMVLGQAAKIGNQASNLAICVYPTAMLNMLSTSVPTKENSGMPNTPSVLDPLIEEFADVFEVPYCLPLKRGHNHKIPLKEGIQPINMRPYMHPPTQKDAIESMVKELLDSGVIRHIQSSFSSLVVMVKKKDGSWRMCIDYRQLNKQTVKDKFPIPLIEELIDELHGSMVFFKLDLRSGYHQIRMFEDDIANPDMQSHVEHLRQSLKVIREKQLYAKASKCTFGAQKVEYLGHIISGLGVSIDPHKIQAMVNWPVPTNLKQLRGFLGLTGYYRRFVKNYASISMPLTALLNKNAFGWNMEAQKAFEKLKSVMTQTLVLQLHDFSEIFIIETDASGINQRITTPAQMKWLPKLMGFDYEIVYKKGAENVVADALSRVQGQTECLQLEVTTLSSELYDKVKRGWSEDSQLKAKIEKLQFNSGSSKHCSWSNRQLLRNGKLVISSDEALRKELMKHFHNGPTGGHSGYKQQLRE